MSEQIERVATSIESIPERHAATFCQRLVAIVRRHGDAARRDLGEAAGALFDSLADDIKATATRLQDGGE